MYFLFLIILRKDTKKTLMFNAQCSIIFEAYLFNYIKKTAYNERTFVAKCR